MVTIDYLMKLEKELLEINENKTFELSLNDYVTLQQLLDEIGKITNSYFYLQQEYFKKYGDEEKLKTYHDKLKNNEISYDVNKIEEFLKRIN